MAITYQRNTWETGKVITAKALNDIETGIVNIVEKLNNMDGEVASNVLTIEDDASIGGDASISGNISIGGTATVTEKATFNGSVEISGATTINGATVINGTTAINNDITVGTDKHIILSASPSDNKHAVTKKYVDDQVNTINNKTIASGNAGIVSSGKLGVDNGITLTLQPATSETLGGIKVGDKLSFTNNVLNLPVASTSALGGIKVGSNLTINETGVLNATDTTYALASTTADGLMSSNHFDKLENDVVTGISINGGTTQSPTNGVVNISVLTEANLDSPAFSGVVNFGDQISIDANNNKITINQTDITESQLNTLYSILPQDSISDGEYTLKLSKSTVDDEPVFTYSWVPVSQQESGGEGS